MVVLVCPTRGTSIGGSVEEWKDIVGYEGHYEASSHGRIRSRFRVLKLQPRTNGYLYVTLCAYSTQKSYSVHRLIAEAFCDNTHQHPIVNHLDEVKHNNVATNLEWCTYQHNADHSIAKVYTFNNPEGVSVTVRNLRQFSLAHGLKPTKMHELHKGERRMYKGWTI